MYRRKIKKASFDMSEITEFLNQLTVEKPLFPLVIPLLLVLWSIEKWVFNLSNWVPLAVAVWATIQYGSYRRRILVQDLNKKWKQLILQTSVCSHFLSGFVDPTTPLEHCEWLNKLLIEVWPNFISPKLSLKFSSIVEKRLKHRKPKLIERIELQEFSLGSRPPILGMHGAQWSSAGDQRFIRMGFDWDTTDISIMLLAKLAKPMGTARIVINNLHIKGDLILSPILDGKAFLYSFVSTPEVRIGVAFGSGGSQSLPATELPGVSSWLVKLCSDTLNKTMVEPRRRCLSLPPVDLRKKAVGGVLHVTVVSAGKLSRSSFKGSRTNRQQSSTIDASVLENHEIGKDFHTFVEVELEDLTRKTLELAGPNPTWDSTFNMILHDDAGILKYCTDDSTIFWAIGAESSVIAQHAEFCGKEVEMVVPFEGINSANLKVKLTLKEWQFSDGLHSLSGSRLSSRGSLYGSSIFQPRTGRKIYVTVVEAKELLEKDKSVKSYVKLQYGKTIQRTRGATNASHPSWSQKFEFEEISDGEYLKIKCYNDDIFGDENIGGARVNLEGLMDGVVRDVWIPLEKVNKGEVRLQIEAVTIDDFEGSKGSHGGLIELVLIEGRDLVAADIRGTSDPYVRVHYGNLKRRTKVMYKTLNPQWHQTFEFPDDGSLLALHVKDHNALLPTSSIGDCIVEYQRLPPNEMSDKWIPLQGVKRGEIHVQVTRKVPELQKKTSASESTSSRGHKISIQMKEMMIKIRSLIEDENLEEVSSTLSELESLHEVEEECIIQLETEQMLLLNKINELGQEIINSSPSLSRRSSSN
ncbi:C2 calcium-dependent membrane targeting [Cynara cardunculus var. scolymus]|uniref:C2 calcium-dependent membrane targeting n=1 Tax=Cynara cardunculus var. scolymus TaxID=59895 RepID=A0A103Y8H9_CYNCS|nr:C2 calcium-dependent membrane targeting [Cynara cardunculus var. scolymus]